MKPLSTIPRIAAAPLLLAAWFVAAQTAEEPDTGQAPPTASSAMSNERLGKLIRRLDADAEGRPGLWRFRVEERVVMVITDEAADRMRIMTAVVPAENLSEATLFRLMQSNFDTALDARYAIAQGFLWSVYLHPLRSLGDEQFLSGLGQVVNLAATYGSTYSSGGLIFRGGDSDRLIEELKEKGLSI